MTDELEPVSSTAQRIEGAKVDVDIMPSIFELYDQLEAQPVKAGTILEGTVSAVGDVVSVDLGLSVKGHLSDGQGLSVGESVRIYVEQVEADHVVVSRGKAARLDLWSRIDAAHRDGTLIEGEIVAVTNAGLSVDIGIKAILPKRESDFNVTDPVELIGRRVEFRILRADAKRGRVTVSRRALNAEAVALQKEELLDTLAVDMVLQGTVRRIAPFGAFVDVGGLEGLAHVSDLSWSRVKHPGDLVEPGDVVAVKVIAWDPETEKLGLSMKLTSEDPWSTAGERYTAGTIISGRVVSFAKYGAFVELEPGIEAMVHVSEMSWTQKVRHPGDLLKVGQVIKAEILSISPPNRRMRLSIKRAEHNPWKDLRERLPVGTQREGKIVRITDFGLFINLEDGIDGLVHASDISWAQAVDPRGRFKVGQTVEFMVLEVDDERERVSLGIKQLKEDDTAALFGQQAEGDIVEGKITRLKPFGAFFELPSGLEGLIHISELADPPPEKPGDVVRRGATLSARILSIDVESRRIRLSLKDVPQAAKAPKAEPTVEEPAASAPDDRETAAYPAVEAEDLETADTAVFHKVDAAVDEVLDQAPTGVYRRAARDPQTGDTQPYTALPSMPDTSPTVPMAQGAPPSDDDDSNDE